MDIFKYDIFHLIKTSQLEQQFDRKKIVRYNIENEKGEKEIMG